MSNQKELFTVYGVIQAQTEKAICLKERDTLQDMWFPYSTVEAVHRERATTGYDRLIVQVWIAKKKGLL